MGCVRRLKDELDSDGVVSKVRVYKTGRRGGGVPLVRGALYHMLRNRIYLGEIVHKGKSYPGNHDAIVDHDLWDRVQDMLTANRIERRSGANAKESSLLGGLLFDAEGLRLTPSHASKGGKRYRYYVSEALVQGEEADTRGAIRLPASEVEMAVTLEIARFLEDSGRLIEALAVPDDDIGLCQSLGNLGTVAARRLRDGESSLLRSAIQSFVTGVELGTDALTVTC